MKILLAVGLFMACPSVALGNTYTCQEALSMSIELDKNPYLSWHKMGHSRVYDTVKVLTVVDSSYDTTTIYFKCAGQNIKMDITDNCWNDKSYVAGKQHNDFLISKKAYAKTPEDKDRLKYAIKDNKYMEKFRSLKTIKPGSLIKVSFKIQERTKGGFTSKKTGFWFGDQKQTINGIYNDR